MSVAEGSLATELRRRLRPAMTVAVGDGVGAVGSLADGTVAGAVLSDVAHEIGGIHLLLGWLPAPLTGLRVDAFHEVVALMPGWGVRDVLRHDAARFVPTRLTGIAALLDGPLRPDLLLTRLTLRDNQYHFTTEVSWQHDLIARGVPVLAVLDDSAPAGCSRQIDPSVVTIVGHAADRPGAADPRNPEPVHNALADEVLRWIPAGARLQYGPGQLGTALLRRTQVPLQIDTGLFTDAAAELDRRGLSLGTPSATYLLGSDDLYRWADGRGLLREIGYTHDVSRLAGGDPFIAVNTAIEIDRFGQVNVEGRADKIVGGIGGHPDYSAAGRMSPGGLSIIAVPTSVNGRSPLVDTLSRPVSTPAHDIDIVVTDRGSADLRGASWAQREQLITGLFDS